MTDIALDHASEGAVPAPFFTRRIRALLRLQRIRRRRARLDNDLHFADDRTLADIGLRRDRHRDDWLTAFLSR
jgi:uncharacterized protein YjiS (DUF1127 family)